MADVYDQWYPAGPLVDAAADRLAALAAATGGGPVLELGIGSGRLALALAQRAVAVEGVDASPAMVALLRAKPGGDAIAVTIGDMATDAPPGPFSVVFVAWNTFFALDSEDAQLACLRTVRSRLRPGGVFVVEAFVPADDPPSQALEVRSVEPDRVVLTATRTDALAQRTVGQFIELTEAGGVRLRPFVIRYASPTQLDALATAGGLRLTERWEDWAGRPFGPSSPSHVSVYTAEP